MAQRWTFEEDYIVCKFCIEKQYDDIEGRLLDELIDKLVEAGYNSRSPVAVYKRARDFTYLLRGWESPYAVEQVRAIYVACLERMENYKLYSDIKAQIEESYNPNEEDISESAEKLASEIFGMPSNMLQMKHTIDKHQTFPMVLQKYVDKKGITIYTKMCKRIGIKPDTFSAILRGRYDTVKKENVLRLCVGLGLHVDEAEDLLDSAGYKFSKGIMTDVVVRACLWNGCHSVVAINAELVENKAPILFDKYEIDYEF